MLQGLAARALARRPVLMACGTRPAAQIAEARWTPVEEFAQLDLTPMVGTIAKR